jgi:hypothetical protein
VVLGFDGSTLMSTPSPVSRTVASLNPYRSFEITRSRYSVRTFLLECGLASSVWWVTVDIIAALRYPGYSYSHQIISELSAEGAPTRNFLMTVNAVPYAILLGAFGVGVLTSNSQRRARQITGVLLIGQSVIGFAGGILFPMAMRGKEGTWRNVMHVPYGLASVILFLLLMYSGAALSGRRFQYYSYGSILIFIVSGVLSGVQSGRMVKSESTPWMGIEERISVYIAMLWIAALSITLLRKPNEGSHRWIGARSR